MNTAREIGERIDDMQIAYNLISWHIQDEYRQRGMGKELMICR
jgi:hypothetical protein